MVGLVSPKHGIPVRVGTLPPMNSNLELVEKLVSKKSQTTSHIIKAFKAIDRKDFVLPQDQDRAYEDNALLIGYGATISQPTTVAIMLENLQPQAGDKVLEIGTGSGYLTALLACIVGDKGKVFSIEYVPELKAFAENNLEKYEFENIKLFVGDGKLGLAAEKPFDKIISSASAAEVPKAWKEQLKTGGQLLSPVGDDLAVLEKLSKNKFKEEKIRGFVFVPLQ